MTSVNYTSMTTVSTTSANILGDDIGPALPAWDIYGISQVLLPVLCALFITVVIIVIACCLIQKKSKSSGVLRQKSSHTIETLHEVSDHDIYDVIDELRVKRISSDKIQSRHGKLDYNSLLASHRHGQHPKLTNVFTSSTSAAIPCQCASRLDILTSKASVRNSRDWVCRNREPLASEARLSTNTDGGASSLGNDDDGIYETLDRHWTLKSDHKVHHLGANCLDGSNECGHKHSHADVDLNIKEVSENSSSQSSHSSQELQPPDESSAQHGDARKLVCQISMFEFSNEESKPALIETTYYQIQRQVAQIPGVAIPELLHKTNLRIVQENTTEENPNTNLLLKALKEDEVMIHQLSQSLVRKNSQLVKPTKIYEKLHRSSSKRVPTLLVKKSESFRTASSELHAAKEKSRISRRKSDSSDFEAPQVNARLPTRRAQISAGTEVTRILTKLGPLPPVPGVCQGLAQQTESKPGVDIDKTTIANREVNTSEKTTLKISLSSNCLLKKQSQSLNTDWEMGDQKTHNENNDNILRYPAVRVPPGNRDQQTTDILESTTACEIEITVAEITDQSNFKNSKSFSGMQGSCSDTTSTDSVCRVSVGSGSGAISPDLHDGDSNYYFVLEPQAGTSLSSGNSEVGSGSDCGDIGYRQSLEVQRETGDSDSRCSIEVPT